MTVIIAGCRERVQYMQVSEAIDRAGVPVTKVISGGCPTGADMMGEMWAKSRNIRTEIFYADWETHGKKAGPIRNAEMVKHADALIAVWDGKSPGTADVIRKAEDVGLRVYVHRIDR